MNVSHASPPVLRTVDVEPTARSRPVHRSRGWSRVQLSLTVPLSLIRRRSPLATRIHSCFLLQLTRPSLLLEWCCSRTGRQRAFQSTSLRRQPAANGQAQPMLTDRGSLPRLLLSPTAARLVCDGQADASRNKLALPFDFVQLVHCCVPIPRVRHWRWSRRARCRLVVVVRSVVRADADACAERLRCPTPNPTHFLSPGSNALSLATIRASTGTAAAEWIIARGIPLNPDSGEETAAASSL